MCGGGGGGDWQWCHGTVECKIIQALFRTLSSFSSLLCYFCIDFKNYKKKIFCSKITNEHPSRTYEADYFPWSYFAFKVFKVNAATSNTRSRTSIIFAQGYNYLEINIKFTRETKELTSKQPSFVRSRESGELKFHKRIANNKLGKNNCQ